MNHDKYDDSYIRGILNTVKTIAMVGVSANDQPAELFCLQVSARARLPHDPGQSRARRPGIARTEGLRQARRHPRARSTWSTSSAPRNTRRDRRGGARADAASAGDLDAARHPQRRGGAARGGERHQGGDEPLPEDRIRPPVVGDRLDGRQHPHHLGQEGAAVRQAASSAWRSIASRWRAAAPTPRCARNSRTDER